jgi:hypothetical protein
MADARHQLGDLCAMRLVGWQVEQHRHTVPTRSWPSKAPSTTRSAARGGRQRALPERIRGLGRQRMHEADRAAVRHHLDEDLAQRRVDCGVADTGAMLDLAHA